MISGSLPSLPPMIPSPASTSNSTTRTSSGEGSTARPANASWAHSKATSQAENAQGLEQAQLKELTALKARDREVRAHEQAHQAVGGQYAGSISYVYQRGPDGAQYAVGGEVSIDVSPVQGDPQATIEKMRVVRSAAMAPAEPSAQDRAVAAQAMQTMLQAQAELASEVSGGETGAERAVANARVDGQGNGSERSREASNAYQSVSRLDGGAATGQAITGSSFLSVTA